METELRCKDATMESDFALVLCTDEDSYRTMIEGVSLYH